MPSAKLLTRELMTCESVFCISGDFLDEDIRVFPVDQVVAGLGVDPAAVVEQARDLLRIGLGIGATKHSLRCVFAGQVGLGFAVDQVAGLGLNVGARAGDLRQHFLLGQARKPGALVKSHGELFVKVG